MAGSQRIEIGENEFAPELTCYELPARARFSLRGSENAIKQLAAMLPYRIAWKMNGLVCENGCMTFRLGPDEWMIELDLDKAQQLQSISREVAVENPHALIDISSRERCFALTGALAATAINVGTAVDFEVLEHASALRSSFEKASIVIVKMARETVNETTGDHSGDEYRVYLANSWADYVIDRIKSAAPYL